MSQNYEQQLENVSGKLLPDHGFWHWMDPENDTVEWSDKFFELLGYNPQEFVPSFGGFQTMLHPDDVENTLAKVNEAIATHQAFDIDYRIKQKSGYYRWFRGRGTPYYSEDGQFLEMAGSISDIELVKQLEHKLTEATQEAKSANQKKSEFLANMSHEIRTPMNAILGLTELVLNSPLEPKQHNYLSKIQSSSQSLLNILNDILDYSKIEAGKLELYERDFDLDEILANTSGLFSNLAEQKSIELIFSRDPALTQFYFGDGLRISQVINNFMSNAIKFTSEGHVEVKVSEIDLDNKLILQISVQDTGIGMSDEALSRLFQPFEQADNSTTRNFGGTGLGLTISKRLAKMMRGSIEASSELGQGTTLKLSIPLTKAKYLNNTNRNSLQAANALIVDDHEKSREMLKELLTSWGFEVSLAASGMEALDRVAIAKQQGHPFDLLLLDWQMPEMNGIEVAREVYQQELSQQLSTHAKVVMVTAYGKEQARLAAQEVPINAYLEKPVIVSQLYNTLLALQLEEPTTESQPDTNLQNFAEQLSSISGAQILLVEDNPTNQLLANDLLTQAGLNVTIADNGAIAVELFKNKDFDLILMDIQMPVMDGFQATEAIRQLDNGKDIPILAMTAAALVSDREQTRAAGMDGHITKPIDLNDLAKQLLKFVSPKPTEASVVSSNVNHDGNRSFTIEGLELQEAVTRIGGQWELLRQLVLLFQSDFSQSEHQIEQSLQSEDWVTAIRIVHSIKGTAATIGALTLSRQASEIEHLLQHGECPEMGSFYQQLEAVLSSISATDLTRSLESLAEDGGSALSFEQISEEIKSLLDAYSIVDAQLLDSIHLALRNSTCAEEGEHLIKQINSLDYSSALQTLNIIIEKRRGKN